LIAISPGADKIRQIREIARRQDGEPWTDQRHQGIHRQRVARVEVQK
jgi:hypothetical protein